MENDQTIFENSTNLVNQPPQPIPFVQNVPPVQNVPLVQPVLDKPPVLPGNNMVSPPTPPKKRLSFHSNFLKIILGFIVLILVLGLISFFVISRSDNKQNGEVTLNYWGLWEDSKTMQPVIDDFQRQNPNIKVKYVKQDPKQYKDTLIARTDNGNGPDIFVFHNTWYPMFSSLLLPFSNDTLSKKDFVDSFYPVAQKDLIRNGAIYGIPAEMDTLSLYINTDIFKSAGLGAPKTWDDFIVDARALTVKDQDGKIKTAGAAMGAYDNVTHASDILSLLFLQNSVDFKNFAASSDRVQGALNFYTSFATSGDNVWDNTLDPSNLAFSKGNLAMFFGYSWDYFIIKQFNPNLNFQIVSVPQLINQSVNMASYWATGISTKTQHQKEALLFVKYLAQKSTEENLYLQQSKERVFGEPYARVDLADTLKGNAAIYPFILQAKTADSSFFVSDTNDSGLNQELNTYLGNAINSIYNGNSIESTFGTFSQGVSQVFQKYGL